MATTPTAQRPASQDATSSAKSTNPPVATFRFGRNVSAAVFAEQATLPSGKSATRFNVSLRKSFKAAEGNWVHTHTLGREDLLPAAYALIKAADFIAEAKGEEE